MARNSKLPVQSSKILKQPGPEKTTSSLSH